MQKIVLAVVCSIRRRNHSTQKQKQQTSDSTIKKGILNIGHNNAYEDRKCSLFTGHHTSVGSTHRTHTQTIRNEWPAPTIHALFSSKYPKLSSAFEIDWWWIFHYECMQTLFNQIHSHTWTTDLASIKMHDEPHAAAAAIIYSIFDLLLLLLLFYILSVSVE